MKKGLDRPNVETAKMALVAFQIFFKYRFLPSAHRHELFRTAFHRKLQDALAQPLVPISDLMRRGGAALFDQRLAEAGNRHRFVKSLCDSGTVQGVNFLHAVVTSLSCPDAVIRLEAGKDANSVDDYHLFFQEVHDQIPQNQCEFYENVCGNLQARVTLAWQSILNHNHGGTGDACTLLQSHAQLAFPLFTSDGRPV
jgi:hypothetical protein